MEKTSSEKANTLARTFSRSSSRLSLQEDFDDAEFACPFDMDDDDVANPGSRYCTSDFVYNICYCVNQLFPCRLISSLQLHRV